MGSVPSALSITRVTSAIPRDFRLDVPEKMTSSILPPRSIFGLCSPNTQRIASLMLLLPLPFGPTIQVIPLLKSMVTGSAKDLNPCISIFLKYMHFPFHHFFRCLLLSLFFALSSAFGNRSAVYDQLHDKCLVMIRPDLLDQAVLWISVIPRLCSFSCSAVL